MVEPARSLSAPASASAWSSRCSLRSYPTSGFTEVVLFVGILVALLLQSRRGGREQDKDDWSSVQPWPPLSARLAQGRARPAARHRLAASL